MNFSAIEICKIGIEVERNGYRFYEQAQAKVNNESLHKMFGELAEAEKIHERTYIKILEQLEAEQGSQEDCCFEQEYSAYLTALANSRVFTADRTPESVIAGIDTPAELITTAMGFEKDAILWLTEMRNWVKDDEKPIIEEFIKYEKEHLATLSTALAKLPQ